MTYLLVDVEQVRKLYLALAIRTKVAILLGEDPIDLADLKYIAIKTRPILEEAMQKDEFNDLSFKIEMQMAFDEVAASASMVSMVGESPFVEGWYLRALEIMEESVDGRR